MVTLFREFLDLSTNLRTHTLHEQFASLSLSMAAPLADYDKLLRDGKLSKAFRQVLAKAKPDGDCLLHGFATGKDKAYGQVRFEGAKYYCHILSAMKRTGRAPQELEEASHLCGNPRCVQKEHLAFDKDGLVNKSRGCCQLYLGVHPGFICPHEPACIVKRA